MIRQQILLLASTLVAVMTGTALAESPLQIARQGSLEAGGRVINCATNDGGDVNSRRWPPGHVVINNVYRAINIRSINAIPTRFCSTPAAATPRVFTTPRPTDAKAGSRFSCVRVLQPTASIASTPAVPAPTSARSTRCGSAARPSLNFRRSTAIHSNRPG
jgi:hypothetical protein